MTLSSSISKTASLISANNMSNFSKYPSFFIDFDDVQISCHLLDSATIEEMCNFPNIALMCYMVIKYGFMIFSDYLVFSTATFLILSDNECI